MTTKFKILSAISFIALAIVLTFVGVWALTDLDFTVGGNITYTAPMPEATPAEDVSYLTFEYDDTNNTAKLTACSTSAPETIEIPSHIKYNNQTYTVTSTKDGYVDYTEGTGEGVFYGLTHITDIKIPDTMVEIGDSSFAMCEGLESVIIPDSVKRIGKSAFDSCSILASVSIGNNLTSVGDYAFWGTAIASISIPDSCTSIGIGAFQSCSSLITCDLGSGLKSLEEGCFSYTSLTSITIPDSVTSIGMGVFSECAGLESVTIGSGVTSIGEMAFDSCTSLATVEVKATTVPTGGLEMFYNCTALTAIYVPSASVTAYQSATYWSTYADYIKAGSF